MAMSMNNSRRRGRRGGKVNAEINIAPLVDVMLVLLLIFMMTAKDLLSGVPIELPKTDATTLQVNKNPIVITVQKDGEVFLQDDPVSLDDLIAKLAAMASNGYDEAINLKGDGEARYEDVMIVMSRINGAGFSKINLATDPKVSK